MGWLDLLRRAVGTAKAVQRLFELQDNTTAALEAMRVEIAAVKDRLAAPEAEQRLASQQAANAASVAATAVVAGSVGDMARRIGHLEAGLGRLAGPSQRTAANGEGVLK